MIFFSSRLLPETTQLMCSNESKHKLCASSKTVFIYGTLQQHKKVMERNYKQGRRHGFESGGDNFESGASKKNFFDPPLFGQLGGGTKYCLDS